VDFPRGYRKAEAFVRSSSGRIMMPSIVVVESYGGVKGEEGIERSNISWR